MAEDQGASASRWVLPGIAALLAIGAVVWVTDPLGLWRVLDRPDEQAVQADPPRAEVPTDSAAAPTDGEGDLAPDDDAVETASDDEAVPSFDLVRIDPDGAALIAGRTAPKTEIDVLLDDAPLAMATTDTDGSFVALTMITPSDKPRVLTLLANVDGSPVRSKQTVIVAPIVAQEPVIARDAPQTIDANQPDETEIANLDQNDDGQTPQPTDAAPEDADATPTVIVADPAGVRLLQSTGRVPMAADQLSIDTITYDADGEVVLGGRGGSDVASVRIYLDNRPLGTAPMGEGGDWRAALPELAPQVYTLRIDALDAGGNVTARAETPFRPETPEAVEGLVAADGTRVSLITVQPGNSLWRIADETYGDGFLFVRVFEANADKIRDPDLIYPGQIFTIPD